MNRDKNNRYLLSAVAILESPREVAKDVTDSIVGEKKVRGELGPRSGYLLGLFGGLLQWFWTTFNSSVASGLEVGRIGFGVIGGRWIRVLVGIWRAISGPVARAAALVASGGRCTAAATVVHFFSFWSELQVLKARWRSYSVELYEREIFGGNNRRKRVGLYVKGGFLLNSIQLSEIDSKTKKSEVRWSICVFY